MITFARIKHFTHTHKAVRYVALVVGAILVAGGGWWGWMEWRPIDPKAEVYGALVKSVTSPANAYKMDMTFAYNTGLKVTMSSTVRTTDDTTYMSLAVSGGNSFVAATYRMQMIIGKDGIYLRPSNPQILAAIMASMGSITADEAQDTATSLQDKWVYISYDDIRSYDVARPAMRCFDSLRTMKLDSNSQQAFINAYKNDKILTVGKRLSDEVVGGESSRRFEMTYNTDTLSGKDPFASLSFDKHIEQECADLTTQLNDYSKASGVSTTTAVYRAEGQAWVGKYSGEMTKMTQHIVYPQATADLAIEFAHRTPTATQLPLKSDTLSLDAFLHYDDQIQP